MLHNATIIHATKEHRAKGGAACAFFKFDSGPKKYVKKVINLIEDSHIK
jgi:hypothetical protein